MTAITRLLDPTPVVDLADYVDRLEGGEGLAEARRQPADSIVTAVEESGLRGRGGAGFPTGRKWRTIASQATGGLAVVVNAAEGEPGTFKDRMLLRDNPYAVLEGACIAARAVSADHIVIATKASFRREIERLQIAIDEVTAAGWTDSVTIKIAEGPGEYLFGEETALLEVIEGRPPFPRVMPPYRHGLVEHGDPRDVAAAPPTLIDNVETMANIPGIVHRGAAWYRLVGTRVSPGTIVCTVTGATSRHGVAEFALGTTLREVIEVIGDGVPDDVTAVLMGVSNPPLSGTQLDVPLTYEDLGAVGSGLGSASFIVVDESTPLRDVAAGVARFLSIESCGQCTPCKHDALAVADHLLDGDLDATLDHLDTVTRGARCALAGQTERVVGRLIDMARDLGETLSGGGRPWPVTPLVDIVDGRAVAESSHMTKRADWSFADEGPDSYADPAQRYADQPVVIRAAHVAEPGAGTDRPVTTPDDADDPFEALRDSHAQLEAAIAEFRQASPSDQSAAAERLRTDLGRHHDATQRFLYPLLDQLEPELGPDVMWYPEHHEADAQRLLARLEISDVPAAPRLIDELGADVHASIIEIERRILPLIEQHLRGDRRERQIGADLDATLLTGLTDLTTDRPARGSVQRPKAPPFGETPVP